MLDRLDALGLTENTIIVFTSDNGGVVSGDGFATNLSPLRGGKGYQWEGGIKVPYLLYAPGYEGGVKIDQQAVGTDFYPTLLDLAGLEANPRDHVDGRSLVPSLKGEELPQRDLVWHYPHYGNQGGEPSSILRRGDWKLIHYYEDGRNELYDLSQDAGERNDLAAAEGKRTNKMAEDLMAHLERRNARYPEPDPAFDPKKRQAVRDAYRDELMPKLERWRKARFEEDWQPNEDWWGSDPQTVD